MEESQRDLTGNLPREIVQLILSFLSVKEATKTCVLSTAWGSLWKPLAVKLEADDGSSDHQIITSHGLREAMKKVIASFLGNQYAFRKLKISVGHQIFLVATKGCDNCELHLDFYKHHDDDDDDDDKVITILTGNNDFGPINNIFPVDMQPMNSFLPLKAVHLRSVTAGLAENFVSDLLSSCHFLENMKFQKCSELRRIHIVVSGSSSLQMVEFSDCPKVDSMVVSAPNLRTLYYAGVLPTTISLLGTPGLVDVKFDVGCGVGQNQFDCEQLIFFLASLEETEFLTISGWIIEWMCSAGVIFGSLDFKWNKLKKLWCIHSAIDARKRDSLTCFLNLAPLLEMLFISVSFSCHFLVQLHVSAANSGSSKHIYSTYKVGGYIDLQIDQKCISMSPPFFHQHWHEPHLWKDYTTVKLESSHLACLKVIKLIGFSSSAESSKDVDHEELLLMDILLHRALNLKAMILTPSGDDDPRYVSKVPASQISTWKKNNPQGKVVSSRTESSLFVIKKN